MKGSQLSLLHRAIANANNAVSDYVETPIKRVFFTIVSGINAAKRYWKRSSSKNTFLPLTPIIDSDSRILRYEHELVSALSDPQVRNIAVTGDYGAGKSSFIRTFEYRNPQHSYAYVSLATFETPKANQDNVSLDETTTDRIEETIVQQLLYSVSARKLPKSRLKRIYHLSPHKVIINLSIFALTLIAALRLYKPKEAPLSAADTAWLNEYLSLIPTSLAFLTIGGSIIYIAYHFIRAISNLSADGWTIKGGLPESVHHSSVLHKHVDELMYCFERSDIDIVFIEDLDRFEDQNIFFRLREINFIINRAPQIKRPIFFIYAIRDELFSSKDRTKFFDLIIPIIPIINSENSLEKFNELLKQRKSGEHTLDSLIDQGLLEAISYYVDDMRLVINIVNEFDAYSSALIGAVGLSTSKLFASIVIKNLYPAKYASLVKKEGDIYKAFEIYEDWKKTNDSYILDEIRTVKSDLSSKENLISKSLQDLRTLLWHKAFELGGNTGYAPVYLRTADGTNLTAAQFCDDTTFNSLRGTNQNITTAVFTGYNNLQTQGRQITPKQLLSSIDPNYDEQERLINSQTEHLNRQLLILLDKQTKNRNIPFKAAVQIHEFSNLLTEHFTKQKMGVLLYLLRSGYLDTDYHDYIGYFYPGSLSYNDKNLIISLREGALPPVDTKIDNPAKVLEKLSPLDLSQGRGLINGLVDRLTGWRPMSPYPAEDYLQAIFADSAFSMDRLEKLLDHNFGSSYTRLAIRELFTYCPSSFRRLLLKGNYSSPARKQDLLLEILKTLSNDNLDSLSRNPETTLIDIISDIKHIDAFIKVLDPIDSGDAWFKSTSIRFRNLTEISKEHLSRVITAKRLELNLHSIRLVSNTCKPDRDPSRPITYQFLSSLALEGFDDLISLDPSAFVNELITQSSILVETPESLAKLLSFIWNDEDTIGNLLSCTDAIVLSLNDVPDPVWPALIQSVRVQPSWETLVRFYSYRRETWPERFRTDAVGEEIRSYLNSPIVSATIANSPLDAKILPADFSLNFVSDDNIKDSALQELVRYLPLDDETLQQINVSESRWKIILSTARLTYSSSIHSLVLKDTPTLLGTYICSTWATAAGIIDIAALDSSTLTALSRSPQLGLADKLNLWTKKPEVFYSENPLSADEAIKVFIEPESDLPAIEASTLRAILSQSSSAESKKRLVMKLVRGMKYAWADLSTFFHCLNETGFSDFADGRKAISLADTATNQALVHELKSAGYIGSIRESGSVIKASVKTSQTRS